MTSIRRAPHTYAVMAMLIVSAAILTHFVPAGHYDRHLDATRYVVDAGSFQYAASTPANLADILLALPRGLVAGAQLVFCFLIIGGALGVVTKTGIIETIIHGVAAWSRGSGER